jgi:two-component system chemotaxis response regulator CheB
MTSRHPIIPRATAVSGGRVRVMAVDDSVVIRHLVQKALSEDADLEFVGSEANGVAALAQIPLLKPDVIVLDIEMPQMDGLETLRQIRKLYPRLRTIMFSTLTTRGASSTFEALSLGADDYVAKASNAGSLDRSLASLRMELIPKIKQFFVPLGGRPRTAPPVHAAAPRRRLMPRVLAIGVSTGGPQALASLMPRIPAAFPLPILIVQHMPATFTRLLAERLDAVSALHVEEAADGLPITPGRVFVAAGDHHLRIRPAGGGRFVTALDQGPHENSCRPSVDVLFRSVAEHYDGAALFVVLTGMGSDGLRGAGTLKSAGAYGIAQDEASSVVWGMPGAVAKAGVVDRVLPLDAIPAELVRLAAR